MPTAPQSTSSGAAYALLDAWADRDRAVALEDASPGAVAVLFAHTYPAGGPDFRGCSTPPAGVPAVCSVRVGDNLLQLTATPFAQGYGVTAAQMET